MNGVLPNGITLTSPWPPAGIEMHQSGPLPVPYLDSPPEIVDVSTGRQLFVDDYLLEPGENMPRVWHSPVKHPGNPVFVPQSPEERHPDFPACAILKSGGVWFDDSDGLFKMWYMAGYLGFAALATSRDGLHWERPSLDVVPGTNVILPKEIHPDSGSVVIDHDALESEPRYKMMVREPDPHSPGGCARLFTSHDGVHWDAAGLTGPMGDRSTMYYDPFRKKWVQSIRHGIPGVGRCRTYHDGDTFLESAGWTEKSMIPWLRPDNLDRGRFSPAQLYNFDAIAYESLMIGFHQILHGPPNEVGERSGLPKLTELSLSTSRDGFHWHRPNREPFIGARREYGSWEYGYIESSAGMCLIVGEELWIYYSAYAGEPERITEDWHVNGTYGNGSVGLAKLRRDGFASLRPMFPGAETQTRRLRFTGSTLFVNANTAGSKLTVQATDPEGKVLPGLSHADCGEFVGNSTCVPIRWRGKDLSGLGAEGIRLQFKMDRGDFFSFWIADSPEGKSGGFTAGGGPGLTGGRDL